jgi:glutamate dehydrogenase (NAD(P)+)
MHAALHEVRDVMMANPQIHDMRTAAYVCAINKVGAAYEQLGIFP